MSIPYAQIAPQPQPQASRNLGPIDFGEGFWKWLGYSALGLLLVVGFFTVAWSYWVPAHGGVDQNGYLVGGKMMALTGTTKLAPRDPYTGKVDPYGFVGAMWVGVDLGKDTERFYPKYPIGLPALVAGARLLGGQRYFVHFTYLINPLCMTLGVAATFLLARRYMGSFAALLAGVVLATSPITLGLTDNPSSHASTVCFVTWGMFLLLRWWQKGGAWRAALAGLLIGFAYTIRYTEGLLIIPLLVIVLLNMRWRRLNSYIESGLLLAWWAIPVLSLTAFNLKAMGSWTGYDPTKESTGFAWHYFLGEPGYSGNWETMLRQFNSTGLFFIFPLAVLGLGVMFTWRWRYALLMALWILPNLVIYTFYYWAPDGSWTGYMRFFLTVFPPLVICAFWFLWWLGDLVRRVAPRSGGVICPLLVGASAACAISMGLMGSLVQLEGDQRGQLMLYRGIMEVRGFGKEPAIPAHSLVFSNSGFLHHLQFTGDYQCYVPEVFSVASIKNLASLDTNTEPSPLHQPRGQAILDRLGDRFDQKELTRIQQEIIDEGFAHNKRVFFIIPHRPTVTPVQSLTPYLPGRTPQDIRLLEPRMKMIARWNDPNPPMQDPPKYRPRRRQPAPPQADPNNSQWVIFELMPPPPPATTPAKVAAHQ